MLYLERGGKGEESEGEVDRNANTSVGSAMDIDDPHEGVGLDVAGFGEDYVGEEDDDDDDEGDPSDVAMVPMADILNARYGSENVCRFYYQEWIDN